MHEANYLILQDPLHWAWIDCLGSVGTTKKAVNVGSRHDAHELYQGFFFFFFFFVFVLLTVSAVR